MELNKIIQKFSRRFRFMLCLLIPATLLALLAKCSEVYRERSTGVIRSAAALPEFRTEDVRRIEFRFGAMPPLQLILKDGSWIVKAEGKPEVYASSGKIAELIGDLKQARLLREIPVHDEAAADSLALSPFRKEKDTGKMYYGSEIKVYGDGEKVLLDMMFGNAHYKPVEQIAGNYSMQTPDGRYIRIDRDGASSYYLISRVFAECVPMSGLWVEQLRMNSMAAPVLFRYETKKTDGTAEICWQLEPIRKNTYLLTVPQNVKTDLRGVDKKLKLLAGPFTRDIAGTDTVFRADSVLTLAMTNGFTYILECQDDPLREMRRFGSLTIQFDPEKVQQNPGETAEALEQRKAYLQKQADIEKRWFGNRIFVLQPDVINMIKEIPQL